MLNSAPPRLRQLPNENLFVINSFSKYFCMTGWRIGWLVAPEPLVRPVERLQGNLAISVPTLSQIAAEAAFDGCAEMDVIMVITNVPHVLDPRSEYAVTPLRLTA